MASVVFESDVKWLRRDLQGLVSTFGSALRIEYAAADLRYEIGQPEMYVTRAAIGAQSAKMFNLKLDQLRLILPQRFDLPVEMVEPLPGFGMLPQGIQRGWRFKAEFRVKPEAIAVGVGVIGRPQGAVVGMYVAGTSPIALQLAGA